MDNLNTRKLVQQVTTGNTDHRNTIKSVRHATTGNMDDQNTEKSVRQPTTVGFRCLTLCATTIVQNAL